MRTYVAALISERSDCDSLDDIIFFCFFTKSYNNFHEFSNPLSHLLLYFYFCCKGKGLSQLGAVFARQRFAPHQLLSRTPLEPICESTVMADQMADNGRNESAAGRLTRPRKGKAGIITVVISGPSRSGKSRLAQALVESLLEVTLTYFLFNTYIILFTLFTDTHHAIDLHSTRTGARVHGHIGGTRPHQNMYVAAVAVEGQDRHWTRTCECTLLKALKPQTNK